MTCSYEMGAALLGKKFPISGVVTPMACFLTVKFTFF